MPLKVIDGSPTSISKFIREEEERRKREAMTAIEEMSCPVCKTPMKLSVDKEFVCPKCGFWEEKKETK
jgi:transposase